MKKFVLFIALFVSFTSPGLADMYVIDGTNAGMHASIQFKASHLGISSLWGRFNDIQGTFQYDKDNIDSASVELMINPASLDSNHVDRDIHLTSSDYLDAEKYPESSFVSTAITELEEGIYKVAGNFTLHGMTRAIEFDMTRTGEGETYFGDYRVGFEGHATLELENYGMQPMQVEIIMAIEGIRQ